MIITFVNGFVLISHGANWAVNLRGKRIWQTDIAEALPGNENRSGKRAVSRRQLSFSITAQTLQERVRLEARADAAKLSGLGCAPMHGRSCVLGQIAGAGTNSLVLSQQAWTWQAGDYAILLGPDDLTFDVQPVTAVSMDGLTLTLAENLINNWPAQALCWPVIFGAFTAEKETALDPHHATQKITIAELVSSRSAQVGVTPAPIPGVGKQVVGKTNIIQ